jgi:hypothetical protein
MVGDLCSNWILSDLSTQARHVVRRKKGSIMITKNGNGPTAHGHLYRLSNFSGT